MQRPLRYARSADLRTKAPPLPPLENGDRLDQTTFHERYEAMPKHFRAKLIGGIVYVSSPQKLKPGADGILRSEVFPGLWLDPDAMLRFDTKRLLKVLRQGLASPEHAAFVAKLEKRRK